MDCGHVSNHHPCQKFSDLRSVPYLSHLRTQARTVEAAASLEGGREVLVLAGCGFRSDLANPKRQGADCGNPVIAFERVALGPALRPLASGRLK